MEIIGDMRYKLVALDVGGTLLNSKKEISEENITTIKLLAERGIKFIITTERPDIQAVEFTEILGIEKEEIVAIGDGENDLEMLKLVGFPVTLENGEEILKEIAHMVTASNDDASVAKALKKIFQI